MHKKKVISLFIVLAIGLLSVIPVHADPSTITLTPTNPSGTIAVTATVNSDYTVVLPSSITFSPDDEIQDSSGKGILKYTADYECDVYGTLLGQKVTVTPDASVTMHPVQRNTDGTPKMSGEDFVYDTSKADLNVSVEQPIKDWIPSRKPS